MRRVQTSFSQSLPKGKVPIVQLHLSIPLEGPNKFFTNFVMIDIYDVSPVGIIF